MAIWPIYFWLGRKLFKWLLSIGPFVKLNLFNWSCCMCSCRDDLPSSSPKMQRRRQACALAPQAGQAEVCKLRPIKQGAVTPAIIQSFPVTSTMKMLFIANLVLLPLLAMGLEVDCCFHLLDLICGSYTCHLISRKTGRAPFPRDSNAMCLVNARSALVIHCQSLMKLSKNTLISGIFCQLSKNR